jgi:glycine cleavage system H protein
MTETRYTREHEWVRLADGVATVGITDHAQSQLGDVVFVELPQPGRDIVAGESVATVESVKAASDIYAPVSGRVTEVNAALADDPALVNRAPESDAWFFHVQVVREDEFAKLLDADAYRALTEAA